MKNYEKKVMKIFDVGREQRLVTDKNTSYQDAVIRMTKWIAEEYGEKAAQPTHWKGKVIDSYFSHLMDRYEQGDIAASSLHKAVHAVEKARVIVKETACFGKGNIIRTGLKKERLEEMRERGVVRSKHDITARKATHEEAVSVQNALRESLAEGKMIGDMSHGVRNSEVVQNVAAFQQLVGARISSVFRLKASDVDLEKGIVTFNKDKNNFTRRVRLSPQAVDFLRPLVEGKKEGAPIFEMKDEMGKTLSVEQSSKIMQKEIKLAAERSELYEKDNRFNTHSFRKAYAQDLYDRLKDKSKSELKRYIADHLQIQGANKEQIVRRLRNEMVRINKNNRFKKNFSHEQLRRIVVSLALGHSRVDVVARNYIVTDREREKQLQQTA